jgi:DNA-directed RNA polymerase specialized sigma24 family protein
MTLEAMDAETEAQLLVALRSGPAAEAAYLRLAQAYYPKLLLYALSRVRGDENAAHEITDNTVSRGWEALESFQGGSLLAWLFRIAHNLAADRRRRRQPANLGEFGKEIADPRTGRAPRPYEEDGGESRGDLAARLQRFAAELTTFRGRLEETYRAVADYLRRRNVDVGASRKGRPPTELELHSHLGKLRGNVADTLRCLEEASPAAAAPAQWAEAKGPGEP